MSSPFPGLYPVASWAHCRRRLREIYDSSGSEIAAEGLRRIAELYAIEAEIRGSPPERRIAERQARSAPLVQAFGDWLRQQRARVSPKSRLGEKLAYIGRHWDGLRLFLADGRVEMDSNAVENLVRPIALTRKNALFAGHDEGAVAWGRIASLTQTARLNGVEPYAWLKATPVELRQLVKLKSTCRVQTAYRLTGATISNIRPSLTGYAGRQQHAGVHQSVWVNRRLERLQ